MRNKENPMLISFDEIPEEKRWNACLEALESEYTLSFKDICRLLKCQRNWATKYLKPHLHYVYVSNGAGKGINYLQIANFMLERKMTETTWYSQTEFEEFIKSHFTSISRQTIQIPIETLIREDKMEEFKGSFITTEKVHQLLKNEFDYKLYNELLKERERVIKACATEKGLKLWKNTPSEYKRSASKWVDCTLDEIDLNRLMAVHDLKNYGDYDEEIYRDLFNQGCYRLVLQIPDADGVISQKIYYLQDDEIEAGSIEYILVNYSEYVTL